MNAPNDVEHRLVAILIQLSVIILAARLFSSSFRKFKQPGAVGEILAGILLGPSLFGWLFPDLFASIFLPETTPLGSDTAQALRILSQLGLILLLFLMGLQFDFSHLKTTIHSAVSVSVTGIVLPFGLGIGLAYWMHGLIAPKIQAFGFALFIGTAMSITALPVLARMMQELGIARTKLCANTITAAAADDASGWILLAAVTALARANFQPLLTLKMLLQTIVFTLAMILVARPLLLLWLRRILTKNQGALPLNTMAVLLILLFASSIATSQIGIFAIFGAFLFGAILSSEEQLRLALSRNLYVFVTAFFVPIFFTYTGLRTDIGLLRDAQSWFFAIAIFAVAVTGKFLGCSLAAYWGGFSRNEALCIGSMMNTRGLMELVVINVGYELRIIPQSVFSMLVIMAVATTLMTTPLLMLFRKKTEIEPYLDDWLRQPIRFL